MRLRLTLIGVIWLVLAGAAPAAAQQAGVAPGAGQWSPGPAASGDRNSLAGVIDLPASGATVAPGNLQLSGWFVDQTAQGWAGADDVEIFVRTMDGGGRPLGHAGFSQDRPDVAAALKNPFWTQSGWSATVSTTSLPLGAATLSVYVHTPNKGWWLRQVSITLRVPPPPPRTTPTPVPAAARPPLSTLGNDISYPQCPTGAEPPAPAFAIVGVNGGKPFSANPCLPRQFVWALTSTSPNQTHLGFYLNTADPGPDNSPNWPAAGLATPKACDGSWSADCAYDYGWLSAQDAYSRGAGVAGGPLAAQSPWWLDVEQANSWSGDLSVNAADLQGVVDYLHSQSVSAIGVYSTQTDWEALIEPAGSPADAPFGGLLNWRPGPSGPQDAPSWCSRTVTGGKVKFVQFPTGSFDSDLACF